MNEKELVELTIRNMHTLMSLHNHEHQKIDFFSKGELFTMVAIKHQGIIKAKQLSEHLHCSQARIAKIFTSLESKGYILRTVDEKDRRSENITLTSQGNEYVDEELNKRFSKIRELISLIGVEDTQEFNRLISKVITILKERKEKENV